MTGKILDALFSQSLEHIGHGFSSIIGEVIRIYRGLGLRDAENQFSRGARVYSEREEKRGMGRGRMGRRVIGINSLGEEKIPICHEVLGKYVF